MAFVIADRVRETSTTTGTGNFTLAGAVDRFRTFASVLSTGDTTYYTIADQSGVGWEVGIGTFTSPATLARSTILSSSNGGSVVTFGAGTKDVFISLPASKTNVEDQPNLIEVNSSSAALRITQTGAGNALLVEDSANPDATPFVVNASGQVLIGRTTAPFGSTSLGIEQSAADTAPSNIDFLKNRAGAIVNSGDGLGRIRFWGYDGASNIDAAEIVAAVDGTPGTNDMPGRLVFSTTADGASTPTERMRITNAGNVGIGTTSPTATLNVVANTSSDAVRITQTGAGNALLVEDSANPDSTPFVVDNGGRLVAGYTSSTLFGGASYLAQFMGSGTNYPTTIAYTGASALGPKTTIVKNRSADWSTNTVVQNNDSLGDFSFTGADGTGFIVGAQIAAAVDGTPGTNDMPGRLVFSTTADGASTPTERMRIDSGGNVGIGTSSVTYQLTVQGTGQDTANLTDAGNKGGSLFLRATGVTSGSGGALLFGTTFGNQTPFAALKGLVTDGTSNTIGDLAFSTRNAFGDTSLTERMRLTAGGNVGIGTSSVGARLDVVSSGLPFRIASSTSSGYALSQFGQAATASQNWHIGSEGDGTFRFYNGNFGAGTERARIDSSGNFLFNSGYGSVATAYGCRAWVNFNGTGTVAIRGSGNVTSITDNGTGDYTVNFTNAMPDVNYSAQTAVSHAGGVTRSVDAEVANFATGSVAVVCGYASSTYDPSTVCVAIFR